jgi:nucleotide-binding universal stress UspA family protein
MERPGRVIVGVSGSLGNMAAVHTAAAAATRTGRTLVAVNAWHPPGGEAVARRSPCPPLDDAAREHARSILSDALASIRCSAEIEKLVLRGQAERVLLAAADRVDDLLVVGTGRRGSITRLTHGTVTRYCVAHARCPVLAVPPSELTYDLTELAGQRARALSTSFDREGLAR